MSRAYGFTCGHCGQPVRIRTSEGTHVCLRTLFLQCTNELCGATYRGFAEITHQYSPAAAPNPGFSLPQPDRVMRAADRRALHELQGQNQNDLFDEDSTPTEASA